MPIVATGFSCRDQDHRCALQSLLPGKLPRADRHHLGLRGDLDSFLPDGRAATRRVDEAASGRAPGGMALRDRQTGWQGSLERKAAFLGSSRPIRSAPSCQSYSRSDPTSTSHATGVARPAGEFVGRAGSYGLARATQRFASLEVSRVRPQFPSKQIANDQDYGGCARYSEITIGTRSLHRRANRHLAQGVTSA
jgi:hypothetical protein